MTEQSQTSFEAQMSKQLVTSWEHLAVLVVGRDLDWARQRGISSGSIFVKLAVPASSRSTMALIQISESESEEE